MRKNELIHLHALCLEVERFLEDRGETRPDIFDEYAARGISPSAIHRQKADHREALQLLAESVATTIDSRRGSDDDRSTQTSSVDPTPPTQ